MSTKRKLVSYKVVHAASVEELETKILRCVNENGYELLGGTSDNGFHYRQTIVKYEET